MRLARKLLLASVLPLAALLLAALFAPSAPAAEEPDLLSQAWGLLEFAWRAASWV